MLICPSCLSIYEYGTCKQGRSRRLLQSSRCPEHTAVHKTLGGDSMHGKRKQENHVESIDELLLKRTRWKEIHAVHQVPEQRGVRAVTFAQQLISL